MLNVWANCMKIINYECLIPHLAGNVCSVLVEFNFVLKFSYFFSFYKYMFITLFPHQTHFVWEDCNFQTLFEINTYRKKTMKLK